MPKSVFEEKPPPPPSDTSPKKRRNIIAILLFFLLFLIIAGGVAAAAWWFWLSPQKQLLGAYKHLEELKSFSYTMTIEFSQKKKDNPDIFLPFMGNMNILDEPLKVSGSMDRVNENTVNFSALVNLPGGFGNLELRGIDRVIYGKIGGASEAIIKSLGFGLEQFYNQWYSFEISKIQEDFGEEFLPDESTLTGKQYDQLTKLLLKHRFLQVSQDNRLDEVNGRRLRYLVLKMDRDKFTDFLYESQDVFLNKEGRKSRQEIEKLNQEDTAFIDKTSFHIWLDMKSFPVRLKWVFENENFSTSTTIELSDINKPALIAKPEGEIKSLNDLIKQLEEQAKKRRAEAEEEHRKRMDKYEREMENFNSRRDPAANRAVAN